MFAEPAVIDGVLRPLVDAALEGTGATTMQVRGAIHRGVAHMRLRRLFPSRMRPLP